jgi:hypothetical protein
VFSFPGGNTVHHALLLLLLAQTPTVTSSTAPALPPSALPSDVTAVSELFGLIDLELATDNPDVARLESRFIRVVESGCDLVLKESAIRDLSSGDRKALSDDVAERVASLLQGALGASWSERRKAVEALGRRATTRNLPAEIVNRWLGFRERPEGQKSEKRPAPEQGVPVAAQVTAMGAGTDLKILVKESRLLEEVGGAGAGNGVIDTGEWVHLRFELANPSPRPWFSSSVAGRADGVCLWMSGESVLLDELPAVSGRGGVDVWVYVSRDCTGGSRGLKLGIRDTHRSPSVEVELVANIRPVDVSAPRLLNARMDSDELGWSDGSRKKEVGPGLRFEYSLDVSVPSVEAASVHTSYATPNDLTPLFETFEYNDLPLGRDPDRIFRAADDLDVTVVGSKAYEATILGARPSRRWVTGRWPGRLWLAVDTDLEVTPPGEKATVPAQPPKLTPPTPLEDEKVVALVRKHLTLAPHPVPPVLQDAVAAASGYEVAFDSSRFAADYHALAWPAPPVAPTEAAREALKYRYRLYQSLPLMAVGVKEPPPPVVRAAPAPRAAPVVKPPPVPPEKATGLVLDIGGTWTGYPAASGVDTSIFGSTSLVDVGSLSVRLQIGTEWVGIARVAYGRDGVVNNGAGDVNFQETTVEGGVGYVVELTPEVALVPRGGVMLNVRNLTGSGSQICPALEVGATLRLKLGSVFGLYADLGGQLGAAGPLDKVSGFGFRLGAGISFNF